LKSKDAVELLLNGKSVFARAGGDKNAAVRDCLYSRGGIIFW
jgi:hypothetical protein